MLSEMSRDLHIIPQLTEEEKELEHEKRCKYIRKVLEEVCREFE